MQYQQEERKFRMHPELLFSVIKAQAGTVAKAILELVMNSIDAGATKVEITLSQTGVRVSDDGKGFQSRTEIDEFFETFGTPHKEGDAVYGKFRMGRGQIMAFTRNTWRSGEFKMDVDVQGRGLDYVLTTGLENQKGCVVSGEMYEELLPRDLRETELVLSEQCKYTPAPVILNGKTITKDVTSEKWDRVTEDAYIRFQDKPTLAVYNLGVLVNNFSAHAFGMGGVVVSRKQLELNFARNDILRSKCVVWKRIRPCLEELSNEFNDKPEKVKRTEEWRIFNARRLLTRPAPEEAWQLIRSLPLITMIDGSHKTISYLAEGKVWTEGSPKDLKCDRIHASGGAMVVDIEKVESRFGMTPRSLVDFIASMDGFAGLKERMVAHFVPPEKLKQSYSSDHHPLADKELTLEARTALQALSDVNRGGRKLHGMRSDTADAYTDGVRNIWINEKFLKGQNGPSRGFAWAVFMLILLAHEYCHDFDSGVGHTHDAEFYEMFHRKVSHPYFAACPEWLMKRWIKRATKAGIKIRSSVVRAEDIMARVGTTQEDPPEEAPPKATMKNTAPPPRPAKTTTMMLF